MTETTSQPEEQELQQPQQHHQPQQQHQPQQLQQQQQFYTKHDNLHVLPPKPLISENQDLLKSMPPMPKDWKPGDKIFVPPPPKGWKPGDPIIPGINQSALPPQPPQQASHYFHLDLNPDLTEQQNESQSESQDVDWE